MRPHRKRVSMRINVETCRDPDLLAAEVRRLQGVIAAGVPALTDEERKAVGYFGQIEGGQYLDAANRHAATLRGLLERTK